MKDARAVFEAIMRGKGHSAVELTKNDKGRYINTSVQTRWNYFQLGWEMRGAQ